MRSRTGLVFFVLLFMICKSVFSQTEAIEEVIVSKDYPQAIALAETYLRKDVGNKAKILFFLSEAYIGASELVKARETLRSLYQDFPDSVFYEKAILRIADTYYMETNYSQARKVYNYFLDDIDDNSEWMPYVYLKLAYCSEKVGDWNKKKYYMRKIKKEFPSSIESSKLTDLKKRGFSFVVQVGAFVKKKHARNLKKELKNKGFSVYIVKERENGDLFYKVRVGNFKKRERAEDKLKELLAFSYPARIFP